MLSHASLLLAASAQAEQRILFPFFPREKKKGLDEQTFASDIALCASGKQLTVFIQRGLGGRALARASNGPHPAHRRYLREKEKIEDDPGGSCATR